MIKNNFDFINYICDYLRIKLIIFLKLKIEKSYVDTFQHYYQRVVVQR